MGGFLVGLNSIIMVSISDALHNLKQVDELVDETLIGTTTLGKSEPESNSNEGVALHSRELEPHHQMQFSVILGHPFCCIKGCNWYILGPADQAVIFKILLFIIYKARMKFACIFTHIVLLFFFFTLNWSIY